MMMTYEEV